MLCMTGAMPRYPRCNAEVQTAKCSGERASTTFLHRKARDQSGELIKNNSEWTDNFSENRAGLKAVEVIDLH